MADDGLWGFLGMAALGIGTLIWKGVEHLAENSDSDFGSSLADKMSRVDDFASDKKDELEDLHSRAECMSDEQLKKAINSGGTRVTAKSVYAAELKKRQQEQEE